MVATTDRRINCTVKQAQDEYQGFRNYPTWAARLWISNEEQWYEMMQQVITDWKRGGASKGGSAPEAFELPRDASVQVDAANDLKERIGDDLDEFDDGRGTNPPTAGLAADLFNYAWDEIDWLQVIRASWDDWE
jgi:hypothetical protein